MRKHFHLPEREKNSGATVKAVEYYDDLSLPGYGLCHAEIEKSTHLKGCRPRAAKAAIASAFIIAGSPHPRNVYPLDFGYDLAVCQGHP